MREYGAGIAMGWIRRTLARFGVEMDTYMSEASLAERGEIEEAIERLRASGDAYEAEGAVWFRSTAYGDDKDRVVIRSNGIHTYFGADCAYLIDKFSRGFDHLLYVWGALAPRDRVIAVALAGAAPLLWAGFDLGATGDPLHSLHGTQDLAATPNRWQWVHVGPLTQAATAVRSEKVREAPVVASMAAGRLP